MNETLTNLNAIMYLPGVENVPDVAKPSIAVTDKAIMIEGGTLYQHNEVREGANNTSKTSTTNIG